MVMNCFYGMVDRRKAFSLISSRDHCQRSSPSRISNTLRAGFEPARNLSSGFVEGSCAVMITTTPWPRRKWIIFNSKTSASGCCLVFAWLFVDFSLPLLIEALLMKNFFSSLCSSVCFSKICYHNRLPMQIFWVIACFFWIGNVFFILLRKYWHENYTLIVLRCYCWNRSRMC